MNFKQNKFAVAYYNLLKQSTDDAETTITPAPVENMLKTVSFVTSDPALIDALNTGFEEVTFLVNCKNEQTGEDDICEVKIKKESFGPFTITNAEEEITEEDEYEDESEGEEITEEDEYEDESEESEEITEEE